VLLQPIINQRHPIFDYFLDSYFLFKIPAFALVTGLLLIDNFIRKTNQKIADEKAKKAAEDAAKNKAK
jgi:general stress protein CsbA